MECEDIEDFMRLFLNPGSVRTEYQFMELLD
jgi:hypothetical protein